MSSKKTTNVGGPHEDLACPPQKQKDCCRMVTSSLKKWKKAFSISDVPADVFTRSQCQAGNGVSLFYLIYRWLLTLLSAVIIIGNYLGQKVVKVPDVEGPVELHRWKWFVYFTNWGQLFLFASSLIALILLQRKFIWTKRATIADTEKGDVAAELFPKPLQFNKGQKTPVLYRLYWVVFTTATDLAFVITCLYWLVIYRSNPSVNKITVNNVSVHALNSCIMLVELFVTSHEFRIGHFIFPFTVGLLYGLFSLIYFLLGGTSRNGEIYLYPPMNWNHFGKATLFVLGSGFAVIIAHIVVWFLYKLKVRLVEYLRGDGRYYEK